MLTSVHPKLPMRQAALTSAYYQKLGFTVLASYPDYLILRRDTLELHFFHSPELNPLENDGQVYFRTDNIDLLYTSFQEAGVAIHPNGYLASKPWGQLEFSLLDPDHNLLTFGQQAEN